MSFEKFKEKIKDPTSKEHGALLKFCKSRIDRSRKKMSENYERWDYNDAIFRSQRKIDKEDRAAVNKGNTAKMIVPLTHAQCLTFVAFCCMTLQQNPRFFNLAPTGTEDNPLREPMELILERDRQRNRWNTFLVQFFLDIAKFSLGVAEVCYEEIVRHMRIPQQKQEVGAMGVEVTTNTNGFQPIPVFLGNKVHPISPYRFFPDADMPLTRYQEGHYCGSEDRFDYTVLQTDPACFNTDKIPKFTDKELKERKEISRVDEVPIRTNPNLGGVDLFTKKDKESFVTSGGVVVTKLVIDITPKNFDAGDGTQSLGDEDFPVRYIVWYSNDQIINRFDEAYYLHGMFPYIMGQYIPDQHCMVTDGLADVCDQITTYITWLANTHKASQANAVESKYAVDPAGVDMASLESRSPYIKLKKNAANTDVRRYITQFQTVDATANAPAEIAQFKDLLESVTGLSGFMQGQSSSGRRSATQDKVVTQGAAARGKTTLGSIWDQAFQPLGRQFIANNRQDMEFDTFARIVGGSLPINPSLPPTPQQDPVTGGITLIPARYTIEELYALFHSDPVSIALSEDFFVFDGSLPAEKSFLAQSLQEIFMEMAANPAIAQVMGYGPSELQQLLENIYTLRGVPQSMLPAPTPQAPMPVAGAPNITALPQPAPPAANASVS